MKLLKSLLTVFALAFALIFVTACSSGGNSDASSTKATAKARTIDEIKKSGELRIAVFGDKKPFGYVDNDGSYQGYDIELGNQLAQDLGVKVKYVSVDAANRAEYLISNKVDITLANFTVTDERKKQVDFALPYMKVSLGVVSPKDKVIKDVKELEGKTLIVTKGTTAETYFEKNHPEVKLQKYDQYSDALVVQQASFFAFSTLCLINVISDVASDFAGGLRMPLVKEKVAEPDLMEAYSFSQFITYISAIGGQAFGVWLLGMSTQNFSLVAGINAIFFLVSALILFLGRAELSLSIPLVDSKSLKN